jgi:hypothetical protein
MSDDQDIERRRSTLQRELWEAGHRLGMPTSEAQRARNDRMAELQAQLDALPKREPQETGEAAGSVQIGSFLGSPWLPNATSDERDADYDHPLIREYGSRIK